MVVFASMSRRPVLCTLTNLNTGGIVAWCSSTSEGTSATFEYAVFGSTDKLFTFLNTALAAMPTESAGAVGPTTLSNPTRVIFRLPGQGHVCKVGSVSSAGSDRLSSSGAGDDPGSDTRAHGGGAGPPGSDASESEASSSSHGRGGNGGKMSGGAAPQQGSSCSITRANVEVLPHIQNYAETWTCQWSEWLQA